MVSSALIVRMEAKPGKEAEVEIFLRGGLSIVQEEPATVVWFAIRLGPSTFGIFDAFPTMMGVKRISQVASPRRSWRKRRNFLRSRPLLRKPMSLRPSFPSNCGALE